ncbi:MAG: glycosyltransferase [Nanoarchaeota archaeon]
MKKIGIVIPAYNEEKRIQRKLEEYSPYFLKKSKVEKNQYSILVVINNTKDKTEEIVKNFIKKPNNVAYISLKKGGKGYAVTEGFKYFISKKFDMAGFVDSDLATSPDAFYDLVNNIDGYSGIIGNRWSIESKIDKKQNIIRRFASRIYNFMVRIMFFMKYNDTQCGAKLFKVNELKKIVNKIFITQWAFDINILYLCKLNGLRILEFPTAWADDGNTTVDTIRASIKMFSGTLRLRLIYSPFGFIVRVYDKLPRILKLNHSLIE